MNLPDAKKKISHEKQFLIPLNIGLLMTSTGLTRYIEN